MHKRTFLGLAFVGLAAALSLDAPSAMAAGPDISSLLNKPVLIANGMTQRYVLSTGDPIKSVGAEGGWTSSPGVVGADANYYDRAVWVIKASGSGFTIENTVTHRLLLATGDAPKAAEGGWTSSPNVVGADSNYYNRAIWQIKPSGDGFIIQNDATKRMLLSEGTPIKSRGAEGGWTSSPRILGTDANYYDRAVWKIAAK
jgi:hypothetical protein